ncbi:MAG: hypothetical protein WBQ86_12685 [Candidatus Binatus sp.]
MANQERTFEAGAETYEIRFTQNALYKLEEKLGTPLMLIGQLKVGPVILQTMLWAGLEGARLKHKPPLRKAFTIEEAGDIIDELGGLPEATPIVLEAWQNALVKVKALDRTEGGGDAPANPTMD